MAVEDDVPTASHGQIVVWDRLFMMDIVQLVSNVSFLMMNGVRLSAYIRKKYACGMKSINTLMGSFMTNHFIPVIVIARIDDELIIVNSSDPRSSVSRQMNLVTRTMTRKMKRSDMMISSWFIVGSGCLSDSIPMGKE